MTDEYLKSLRLESISSLALKAQAAGTIEGWREYLASEMKTAGLTGREVAAEMERQRKAVGGGT